MRLLNKTVPFRVWLLVGLIAAALGILITLIYIDRFPQLDTLDELHNWVVQWTYARTGLLGDWFYRQMIPLPQPIYDSFHIPAALLLRVIGDTFWHARLARFLLTLVALPFIYGSGRILYGKRTGLFAVVIAFFFLAPTSFVRPDFGVGIMLSVGFYVYLLANHRQRPLIDLRRVRGAKDLAYSPLLHFLTGLLIGLGGEGHPLAYRFGVAFGLIYLIQWGREIIRRRRFYIEGRIIALGLGGLTAILLYLAIHILPGWEQGTHFALSYSPIGRTTTGQIDAAREILQRQVEVWTEYNPVESLVFAAGVLLAVARFHRGDRLILLILLVSELLMLATYGYYRAFYQVHFLPLFALLMGKVLADGLDTRADPRPAEGRGVQLVIAAVILAISSASLYTRAAASIDPTRDEFEDIGRQFAATFPENARVVGNEDFFLTYRNPNYYGISTVATPAWFLVNLQGYRLWQFTNPDIFILTPELDWDKYVPRDSIDAYLTSNSFTLARCYTATGRVHAYVYVRQMPSGWTANAECQRWDAKDVSASY